MIEDYEIAEPWILESKCADDVFPDDFFANEGPGLQRALNICKTCPVRIQCADYAIRTDEQYGVWGGLTEADRRQIRTSRMRKSRRGIPNKKH
jgi:WhiB family redox-sensing transcriptional regulator